MSEEAKIEELKRCTATGMSSIEKNAIKDRTQMMDEKEIRLTVRNIPGDILWEELMKRYALKTDIIRNVRAAVMVTVDDVDERG